VDGRQKLHNAKLKKNETNNEKKNKVFI